MRISDWSSDVCSSDLLGDTGQEGEHPALAFGQRGAHSGGDLVLDPAFGAAAEIAQVERVGTALALDHRAIAHQRGEARTVERRRHRDQPQIGAQRGLRVEMEEHTSELQSLMRISYAVFCLKKKTNRKTN